MWGGAQHGLWGYARPVRPPFRDEYESLLNQIEVLKEQLAEKRDSRSPSALPELAALADKVRAATQRVVDDRTALEEVAQSIASLRASLEGKNAEQPDAEAPPEQPSVPEPSRTIVLWVTIAALLVIVMWRSYNRQPETESLVTTLGGGNPRALDPMATLAVARARGHVDKGAPLTEMKVVYVGRSGIVDLEAEGYRALVRYTFFQRSPPPKDDRPRPLGVPPPEPLPGQEISVSFDRFTPGKVEDRMLPPFGGAPGAVDALPHSTVTQVWEAAIAAGAPADALASVAYTINGLQWSHMSAAYKPTWSFEIEGTTVHFAIDDATLQVVSSGPTTP
jgi:hypothetical protein